MAYSDDYFVPEHDILSTLPDGRVFILAHAGIAVPMPEALEKGFVKAKRTPGPSETKGEGESDPEGDTEPQAGAPKKDAAGNDAPSVTLNKPKGAKVSKGK